MENRIKRNLIRQKENTETASYRYCFKGGFFAFAVTFTRENSKKEKHGERASMNRGRRNKPQKNRIVKCEKMVASYVPPRTVKVSRLFFAVVGGFRPRA